MTVGSTLDAIENKTSDIAADIHRRTGVIAAATSWLNSERPRRCQAEREKCGLRLERPLLPPQAIHGWNPQALRRQRSRPRHRHRQSQGRDAGSRTGEGAPASWPAPMWKLNLPPASGHNMNMAEAESMKWAADELQQYQASTQLRFRVADLCRRQDAGEYFTIEQIAAALEIPLWLAEAFVVDGDRTDGGALHHPSQRCGGLMPQTRQQRRSVDAHCRQGAQRWGRSSADRIGLRF